MDDYGFRWVKWDAGARAQGKTIEKEAQIFVSYLFCDACQGKKKQELGRDGGIERKCPQTHKYG